MKKNVLDAIFQSSVKYSDSKGGQEGFLNLIEFAAKTPVLKIQPPFLEIGTRSGGSALALLQIIEKYYGKSTVLATVDPYGEKPYDSKPFVYGGNFYVNMKKLLAPYANHIHYKMTSDDFIKIIDNISFWYRGKKQNYTKLSFVFLDGSHLPKTVIKEFENFFPRLITNGYLIIDNTDFYDRNLQKYFEKKKTRKLSVVHTKHQTIIQKNR